MTMETNAFSTYVAVGNKDDLASVIFTISSAETPFLSAIQKSKATAVLHEWQTDRLADADADNAVLEGDVVEGSETAPTVRAQNYCQISRKDVVVTGTQEIVEKHGRESELGYQLAKRGKELKRDMEAILTGNQGWDPGDATTPRKLRSLESWLTTNVSRNEDAATPGESATDSDEAATDASATRAFTEELLKEVVQACYMQGSSPNLLMVGPYNKGVVSSFTGRAQARHSIDPERIQASASLYASDFGEIKVMPNRFQRERSAFIVDPDYVAVAFLRDVQTIELARTGDAHRKAILAEYTLAMSNEAAHGVIADLDVSETVETPPED